MVVIEEQYKRWQLDPNFFLTDDARLVRFDDYRNRPIIGVADAVESIDWVKLNKLEGMYGGSLKNFLTFLKHRRLAINVDGNAYSYFGKVWFYYGKVKLVEIWTAPHIDELSDVFEYRELERLHRFVEDVLLVSGVKARHDFMSSLEESVIKLNSFVEDAKFLSLFVGTPSSVSNRESFFKEIMKIMLLTKADVGVVKASGFKNLKEILSNHSSKLTELTKVIGSLSDNITKLDADNSKLVGEKSELTNKLNNPVFSNCKLAVEEQIRQAEAAAAAAKAAAERADELSRKEWLRQQDESARGYVGGNGVWTEPSAYNPGPSYL